MSNFVKKLIRSVEMAIPGSVNAKYYLTDTYYAQTGKVYKPDLEGMLFFETDNSLIIDVGCNRGQCVRAFKNIAPSADIIAFEPVPFLIERLSTWYRNDPKVMFAGCALSNSSGEVDISVPFYNGLMFDGMASIDPSDINKVMRLDRFFGYDERKLSTITYKVPLRTLDSYNLAPDFIKLHAQRHEIEIIRGAVETIQSSQPIIIAAWAWKEEIELLAELGYKQFAFNGTSFYPGNSNEEFTYFLLPEHCEKYSIF